MAERRTSAPSRLRAAWLCLLLAFARCAASAPATPDPLAGTWRGRAVFRGSSLDFSVRFERRDGALRATISAPDLLLLEAPLDSVGLDRTRVRFITPDDRPLRFVGWLEGDSIRGGAPMPPVPGVIGRGGRPDPLRFVLRRAPAPPPPPYSTRELSIDGAGVRLAATLLVPTTGKGPVPGIVLLQGSSTNLREQYRFYSDHFARAGLAVLTFDKRGKGESTGDYGAATYGDLADDAAAAVELLRHRPEVDPARVGVWGLSQGAFLSPMVAARVPSLRFIVAVSPPGVTTGRSAAYQDSVRLLQGGFTRAEGARAAALNRRIAAWLENGEHETELARDLARVADEPWRRASTIPTRLPASASKDGWYWRGRILDPLPFWRKARTPVLAVFGAEDDLLPARLSARRIEGALREGGNHDATVRVFPAAGHVLRRLPLVAGGAWDWPRVAPGYLELITGWILDRSSATPAGSARRARPRP